jgi:Domain of unknown function (DUF222)/HNH endonuclease
MGTVAKTRIGETVSIIDSLLSDLFELLPSQPVCVADLVDVQRVLSRIDLFCTRMVAAYAVDGSCVDDGFRDVAAVLAFHAHSRKSEGTGRLRNSHVLSGLSKFDAAAESGLLPRVHVGLMATFVTPERELLAVRDEEVLLGFALQFDAAGFMKIMQRWALLCDDELKDPTAGNEAELKRSVSIRQLPDGNWTLKGVLSAEAGQALEAAIENALPKPVAIDPDDDCADKRTITQRRHDALHDVALESLASDERPISSNNQRANISLIVNPDGTAHSANGYFVSSFSKEMLMCDAVFTAIKVNCAGIPFDVGTPHTEIPLRNRRAVIARDRCCRYAGCDRPARWSDIHHIREREHGGAHELANLVLMCRFHHRFIHKFGVQVAWADDGVTLTMKMQNGNLLHAPPHPETLPTLRRMPTLFH